MEKKYKKLRPDSKCLRCLGCSLLEQPSFYGKMGCSDFRQADKKVWCANEAVEQFMRTGKVK